LNVTWNIAYSGSTAEKLELSEFVAPYSRFNVTDTEFNKAETQLIVQNIGAMFSLDPKKPISLNISNSARFHGHKFSSQSHTARKFMVVLVR
jgi:uncharacterized protein YdgA (DUF945 family)